MEYPNTTASKDGELLRFLAKKIIETLDKKCKNGCLKSSWHGFQNGQGEECGSDIEDLINQAKKCLINTNGAPA